MKKTKKHSALTIFREGACNMNGFPAAKSSYGFYCKETGYKGSGIAKHKGKSSNNVGELIAARESLLYAKKQKVENVLIVTDSQYVIGSLSVWRQKKKTKNLSLILQIKKLIEKSFDKVDFGWVRGHDGNELNEIADQLATSVLS